MYIGVEIGGSKLQLGVGLGDGVLRGLWRETVDVKAGPEGIREQITRGIPELLEKAGIERSSVKAIAIGFGGPVDDRTRTVIKSHQVTGWDNFPLAGWAAEALGRPAFLANDADAAALAEALFGAGQGANQAVFFQSVHDRNVSLFARKHDGQDVEESLVGRNGSGRWAHYVVSDDAAKFVAGIKVLFQVL